MHTRDEEVGNIDVCFISSRMNNGEKRIKIKTRMQTGPTSTKPRKLGKQIKAKIQSKPHVSQTTKKRGEFSLLYYFKPFLFGIKGGQAEVTAKTQGRTGLTENKQANKQGRWVGKPQRNGGGDIIPKRHIGIGWLTGSSQNYLKMLGGKSSK